MGYIDQSLSSDERVIYRIRFHWIIFAWPAALIVLGLLLRGGVGPFLVAAGVVFGAARVIDYTTSEFGVTNRRIVGKRGVIRRRSVDIMLTKVEGATVDQGILGRVLDYGKVTVRGTGGGATPFTAIPSPIALRRTIQDQIEVAPVAGTR